MTVKERYRKERKRVMQFINRAAKRGYIFAHDIVPSIPKRITEASIRRLKALTPEALYKKSRYASELTYGEEISGARAREMERSQASKKGALKKRFGKNVSRETLERPEVPQEESQIPETDDYVGVVTNEEGFVPPPPSIMMQSQVVDTIISQFRERASHFNAIAYQIIENWLNSVIMKYGTTAVARMLETGAAAGHILTYEVLYDEKKMYAFLSDFLDYLPDLEEKDRETIMDSVFDEYNEDS